ncbi:MAG: GTPase [Verrucomicrobiota bacterium]|nr:GTPase [Verrucomicrobiota bacterium]
MFVDRVVIHAKAGKGGEGCVSFRREKLAAFGGPDGGDGGHGGHIIVRADASVNNLVELKFVPHQEGERGGHGLGKKMHGKGGRDCIIRVPPGTVIYKIRDNREVLANQKIRDVKEEFHSVRWLEKEALELANHKKTAPPLKAFYDLENVEPEEEINPLDPKAFEHFEPVADLVLSDDEIVLVKGGRGGRGNVHWKSPTHQVPREYEHGREGQAGEYLFILKMIADVGLVGYPNAGKSTLLSKLSNAKPRIAAYPFTTLNPIIGTIDYPDYRKTLVADIPGLIEGAHENVGLGHDFLRHIERCKLLLFVVDMAGSEGREPWDDYAKVRKELKMYRSELTTRAKIIVANKIDLPEAQEKLKIFKQKHKGKVVSISAQNGTGIDELKKAIYDHFYKKPKKP